MAIDITAVHPDDHAGLDQLLVVRHALGDQLDPEDPPIGREELAGDVSLNSSHKRRMPYVAALDGEPAGAIEYDVLLDDDNRHLVAADIGYVVPHLRRRGVASALLRATLPAFLEDGRTSLLLLSCDEAGAAFCVWLGLTHRQDERCSRLRIADLDGDQQKAWIVEAPAAAAGYRLVAFGDRCPDELVPAYCQALDAMADAPLDGVEYVVPTSTEELVRSQEKSWIEAGLVPIRTLAVAPDGSGAGLSDLFVSPQRPMLGWQGDTAVRAEHRGHRLGRWLKAANLAEARLRFPELATIETYNAQSNPWMLAINVDMGFRPHVIWSGWQGDMATALDVVSD